MIFIYMSNFKFTFFAFPVRSISVPAVIHINSIAFELFHMHFSNQKQATISVIEG